MQELCSDALDVENAVVVVVIALGATAATPILTNLAAGASLITPRQVAGTGRLSASRR